MSGDSPRSADTTPLTGDPIAKMVTFVDFAASTIETPRPASTTLDVARHHAFTGEIRFATEPGVNVFLENGVVYHAHREGGASIGRVLLDAGVLDAPQLERGIIRVGDVEHLGRLFDRDDTIDRDAVMVVIENRTDEIVNELADEAIATVTVSAYRHHSSGIHRWFVAPIVRTPHQNPLSDVAQVDRSVVDELPGLGQSNQTRADEIQIEWAEPDPSGLGVPTTEHHGAATPTDADVQAELDRFDADQADWAAPAPAFMTPSGTAVDSPIGEFHIVWPDGTEDDALVGGDESAKSRHDAEPGSRPSSDDSSDAVERGVATDVASNHVEVEPMVVDSLPAPDASVPADIEAAVRRALEAMGQASGFGSTSDSAPRPRPTSSGRVPAQSPGRLTTGPQAASPAVASTHAEPVQENEASGAVGFAPPTLDMRAEAVYARAAAAQSAPIGAVDTGTESDDHGKASVVFVDDDTSEKSDRRGALRRLIGSLRGKD